MKPKRIFLIRHGESEGNVNKAIYNTVPDYALGLTDKGKQQAVEAGRQLRMIESATESARKRFFFYISSYRRTRQTFEGIIQSYKRDEFSFREDPRITEQSWVGNLPKDGFNLAAEREREAYGHFYYRFQGGESNVEVYTRISSFLETLFRDFQKEDYPENTAIVMHGMSMRVFLMRWFHWTVEEFETLANPRNCEIQWLELKENGKYELMSKLRKYDRRTHNYQFPMSIR